MKLFYNCSFTNRLISSFDIYNQNQVGPQRLVLIIYIFQYFYLNHKY